MLVKLYYIMMVLYSFSLLQSQSKFDATHKTFIYLPTKLISRVIHFSQLNWLLLSLILLYFHVLYDFFFKPSNILVAREAPVLFKKTVNRLFDRTSSISWESLHIWWETVTKKTVIAQVGLTCLTVLGFWRTIFGKSPQINLVCIWYSSFLLLTQHTVLKVLFVPWHLCSAFLWVSLSISFDQYVFVFK